MRGVTRKMPTRDVCVHLQVWVTGEGEGIRKEGKREGEREGERGEGRE